LEDQGLRAYIPLPDFDSRTPHFGKLDFRYDPTRDVYTCPGGTTLPFVRPHRPYRLLLYQATAATCNACALKERCTESRQGRLISRSYDEEYVDRVRAYQASEPYQKAIRKRSVWVEPLFGEAREWHGLRRFRLRRLWRVNTEALLTASGQNLKRLLSRAGWGRRPFPDGALGLRIVPSPAAAAPRILLSPGCSAQPLPTLLVPIRLVAGHSAPADPFFTRLSAPTVTLCGQVLPWHTRPRRDRPDAAHIRHASTAPASKTPIFQRHSPKVSL
jgi:hypothetical protein